MRKGMKMIATATSRLEGFTEGNAYEVTGLFQGPQKEIFCLNNDRGESVMPVGVSFSEGTPADYGDC